MEFCLLVYSSITFANAIRKEMIKNGEYVSVINTPKSILQAGCSYSIRIKKEKIDLAKEISDELSIKIKGIYKEERNSNGVKYYKEIKMG